jgi:hypothetical protein
MQEAHLLHDLAVKYGSQCLLRASVEEYAAHIERDPDCLRLECLVL